MIQWLCSNTPTTTTTIFVSGQRFMRQGFSNNEDFGSEMKLDPSDQDAALGMTREMFLMQDIKWQIPPLQFIDSSNDDIVPKSTLPIDNTLRKHIVKYLGSTTTGVGVGVGITSSSSSRHKKPIELELLKKRGKFGLRAIGTMENGKKLRAFWRQSTSMGSATIISSTSPGSREEEKQNNISSQPPTPRKVQNFLKMSYDDAVKSRLFTVEFEIQLPPIEVTDSTATSTSSKQKKKKKVLPSVVYQLPIESGTMNPNAIVPRGTSTVLIYPTGRQSKSSSYIVAGTCRIAPVLMKAGLIDPTWSKGKPIFRKGRFPGILL